jgi:hypothetical protein
MKMFCPECNQVGCEDRDCMDSYEIYLFDGDEDVIAYKEVSFKKGHPPSNREVERKAKAFQKDFISQIRYDFSC